MNYVLKPSLQHMCSVKVVAELWKSDEIRQAFSQVGYPFYSSFGEDLELWMQVESAVIDKVRALPLTEAWKKQVSRFVRPMFLEIQEWWAQYHHETGRVPKQLRWTPQGTVDRRRTVAVSLKDERLDAEKRFRSACFYCLEDEISALWSLIPEERKREMIDDDDRVVYWTLRMRGSSALNSALEMFESAVKSCNRAASEYFFEKLGIEEKNAVLVESASHAVRSCSGSDCNLDLLCFLLSRMSEEQQEIVFERENFSLLKHFLNWPWQCLFAQTAERVLRFVNEREGYERAHAKMMLKITGRIRRDYKDFEYQELLREFWRLSSDHYKERFLEDEAAFVLIDLLVAGEHESVKAIVNRATAGQLERIVFSRERCSQKVLISREKRDLIKFLLDERVISEEIIVNCVINVSSHFSNDSQELSEFLRDFLRV